MFDLGITRLPLILPSRIYEKKIENETLQRLKGSDHELRMLFELNGVTYSCSLEHAQNLVATIKDGKHSLELLTPDYYHQWDNLIENRSVVNRHFVLASNKLSLAIHTIGLDPDNQHHYLINVSGRHKVADRSLSLQEE